MIAQQQQQTHRCAPLSFEFEANNCTITAEWTKNEPLAFLVATAVGAARAPKATTTRTTKTTTTTATAKSPLQLVQLQIEPLD